MVPKDYSDEPSDEAQLGEHFGTDRLRRIPGRQALTGKG